MSSIDAYNRALVDVEVHQVMQKHQMLVNQIDATTGGNGAQGHGSTVHSKVDTEMKRWVEQQNFKFIDVETEAWHHEGHPYVGPTNTAEADGASRVDLHIQERKGTGNPMVDPSHHIIGDIKTGATHLGQAQMAKNQANVVTNAAPVSGSGSTAKYPKTYNPQVNHVQFKPEPIRPNTQPPTIGPRFEFGVKQPGTLKAPGIRERTF